MKFRFCGGADCPDWLLMQINSLSNLGPNYLQELCEMAIEPLIGKEMNYVMLREFSKKASLDSSETKACVSTVTHILRSGSCYGVNPGDLGQELEQLGLHRQHAQALVKVYSSHKEEVSQRLKDKMLRSGRLWTATAVAGTGSVQMEMSVADFTGESSQQRLHITRDQAQLLLAELKTIKDRMEDLSSD